MAQLWRSHKFGWLLNHFGAAFAFLGLAGADRPAAAQVVSAHGEWAAIRFGEQCEARTPAVGANVGRTPAFAGFAFGGRRHGQFHARLGRPARPGSAVILTIAGQPFLLRAEGDWAWGRDERQDSAIMAAARLSGSMRIESRSPGGRRTVDRFVLRGSATAIDSAAAACAQAGKSR